MSGNIFTDTIDKHRINDIKQIVNAIKGGIILNDFSKFLYKETAKYCRQRYEDNFSLEQFEDNLVKIFKSQ